MVDYGISRIVSDYMGMLGTSINSLALQDACEKDGLKTVLMSSIPLRGICQDYNWQKAMSSLSKKEIVIFCAGTGNPLFTTDSAACLRGIEMQADLIAKATQVDGVYPADPVGLHSNVDFYKYLTYDEVIKRELKIMDLTAIALAKDYKIPIFVYNFSKKGLLKNIVLGKGRGTLIKD